MEIETNIGTHRLVHFDFKRSPIKIEYLEKLFPLIKSWGATGLLLEWEDTFPYNGSLSSIGSLNTSSKAYSVDDIKKIGSLAELHCLSLVPLVQTFGHLEFVLKRDDMIEMRESPKYPNCLCPSHPGSLPLVTSIIDQVAATLPPSSRYFHIGADEVWQIGQCSCCSDQHRDLLLLNHLSAVLRHLHAHHPHLRPIMWDDMLRNIDLELLKSYELGSLVDIMIWKYDPQASFHISDDLWEKYSIVFGSVWIASAYKGATGSSQILPLIRQHVSNHEAWLCEVDKRGPSTIRGIAITGWSRYDHYATLCDLLPAAIPSLALCLGVWINRSFTESLTKRISESLGYTRVPLHLFPYPRPQAVAEELKFPGWEACVGVEWLANLKAKHDSIISSEQVATWLNPWQIKMKMTNPMHLESLVITLLELCREWDALQLYMKTHLSHIYYEDVIEEWIYTQVHASKQTALKLHASASSQIDRGV